MNHILARSGLSVLERFARKRVLIAFDFDGTLAPIVLEPDHARMRASTRSRLRRLATYSPCAVISGRARADVSERLRSIPLFAIVGEHGSDEKTAARYAERVRRWAESLRRSLADVPGVDVESKTASIAIHYRRAPSLRTARQEIMRCVSRLRGATRIVGGKCVVNVLPCDAPHKGHALELLRAYAAATTAIYVGDDLTDEDVFSMDRPEDLLSIRVGRSSTSAARYCLKDQGEIDALLDVLIRYRQEDVAKEEGVEERYSG